MLGSVFRVNSGTNTQAFLSIHGNAFSILLRSQPHMYVKNTNGTRFGFPWQQC